MTHFDRFIELDKLVNKTLIVYWSKFEVKGAYIHNESEFKLLSDYFAIGKTEYRDLEIRCKSCGASVNCGVYDTEDGDYSEDET